MNRLMPVSLPLTILLLLLASPLIAVAGSASQVPYTPIHQASVSGIVADYLLITRVPSRGLTDCLFVRYFVTRESVRFVVLTHEPQFNMRMMPLRPRMLTGVRQSTSTWLRQAEVSFATDISDADALQSVPLANGRVYYRPEEMAVVPAWYESRAQMQKGLAAGQSEGSVATSNRTRFEYRWDVDSADRVITERVRDPAAKDERVTEFTYSAPDASGVLTALKVRLPTERFLLPGRVSGDINIMTAIYSVQDHDLRKELEAKMTACEVIPYFHHDGTRDVRVQFEDRLVGAEQQTVPAEIRVDHGLAPVTGSFMRSAHCLSVREIEPEELARLSDESWCPTDPVRDAITKFTGQHSDSWFQGEAAERGLREFRQCARENGWDQDSAPFMSRITVAGRNLDMEVWRQDVPTILAYLREYFRIAADSPLRAFQPDLALWLMRRINASGTQQANDAVEAALVEQFRDTMAPEELLQAVWHIQQIRFTPCACFRWGVEATGAPGTSIDDPAALVTNPAMELSPIQRIMRAWLAANLLHSATNFHRAPPPDKSEGMSFERISVQRLFPADKLTEIADAIASELAAAEALLTASERSRCLGLIIQVQGLLNESSRPAAK